ncbi:hypothetical protein [Streptomyces spectabilis]|uniref:Uncharacterized protein n=1 Tax=Streptomyces spectabilis TaxID=68270 RepID=A0A5P2X456_STRST|nr:hypothetical protein [Streptomyces spectabilis]MBB5103271.1 hypothetical protein [Streptomyces spectabilis]MCI3902462.1 hypothetical protein [Streptomyces spectabilis]QEV59803.1 hypothetical protein CP982_14525 [Streptomyces spectabilis]GGV13723.1 hypothetical protein GCM10010245_23930 [Streptomyces spectabilis]
MNEPLAKAEAAVTEAESNTAAVQLALAAVELAKAAQQPQHQGCQHTPQQQFDAKKWLTIGGLACVGGCVVCALALAFAIAAIAVAIGGTCATACLLILRSIWRGHRKGR